MQNRFYRCPRVFVGLIALGIVCGTASADESTKAPGLLDAALFGQLTGEAGDAAEDIWNSIGFDGQIDVGYTYNFNHTSIPGAPENPLRVFDVFHNEFTVHNVILNVHREANEDQMFGFGFMPSFGTDSSITQGNGFNIAGSGGMNADLDVIEAFGSVRLPDELSGVTIQFGKFMTSAGAEVIASGENANFSRSFIFGFTLPFTHTGVRASRGFLEREDGEDQLELALGYANGWDSMRDTNDGHVVLTSAKFSPVQGFNTSVNWFFGNTDRFGVGDDDSFGNLLDLVGEVDLTHFGLEGFSTLLNFVWYGDENVFNPGVTPGGYSDYWAFAGILKYEFENPLSNTTDDKFYVAFRGEYVDDPDGFISLLLGAPVPVASSLYDLTWTFAYLPSPLVLLRAEVRYDKSDFTVFDNGARHHQTTIAFNTVFRF